MLSDEQLERIEDALTSAVRIVDELPKPEPLLRQELDDALGVVTAARALLAA